MPSKIRRSGRRLTQTYRFDASKNASAPGFARRDVLEHSVSYVGENIPVKITVNPQARTHRAVACVRAAHWAAHEINSNPYWHNHLKLDGGGFALNPRIHLQVLHNSDNEYGRTSLWCTLNRQLFEVYASPQNLQTAVEHALGKKDGLQFEVLVDLNPRHMFLSGVDNETTAKATLVHEWFIHATGFIRTARTALLDPSQRVIRAVHGRIEMRCPNGDYEEYDRREGREHRCWLDLYFTGREAEQKQRALELLQRVGIEADIEREFQVAFDHDLVSMSHSATPPSREESAMQALHNDSGVQEELLLREAV